MRDVFYLLVSNCQCSGELINSDTLFIDTCWSFHVNDQVTGGTRQGHQVTHLWSQLWQLLQLITDLLLQLVFVLRQLLQPQPITEYYYSRGTERWMGCRRGYLSAARCRFAYGPSDATATHCLLLQWNPDWYRLTWQYQTKAVSYTHLTLPTIYSV